MEQGRVDIAGTYETETGELTVRIDQIPGPLAGEVIELTVDADRVDVGLYDDPACYPIHRQPGDLGEEGE